MKAALLFTIGRLSVAVGQAVGTGELCLDVNTSLTCSACPDCTQASCASEPVPLPAKSAFWPPQDILQKAAGPDPIPADLAAELKWFQETVLDVLPSTVKQADSTYALTQVEETLVKMGLPQWQMERAKGTYTCQQMAVALTKRALYLQDIQKMNHFMYWNDAMFQHDYDASVSRAGTGFNWITVVLAQAAELDAKAKSQGVDSIAPLYCYPIPLKGTMTTKSFPSSSGFAALHEKFGIVDAALVTLVADANGVLFGKTNVPELAHVSGYGTPIVALQLPP
jgi:Amidase